MRSRRSLYQQNGVLSPVLTGHAAVEAAAKARLIQGWASQSNSESIANLAGSTGGDSVEFSSELLSITKNLNERISHQKRHGSNIAAKAPGRAHDV